MRVAHLFPLYPTVVTDAGKSYILNHPIYPASAPYHSTRRYTDCLVFLLLSTVDGLFFRPEWYKHALLLIAMHACCTPAVTIITCFFTFFPYPILELTKGIAAPQQNVAQPYMNQYGLPQYHNSTHLMADRCATMMEHATDILNDRTNPLIGITKVASAIFRIESDIPRSSFPSTTAVFTDQSIFPMGTADGERSLATTWPPFVVVYDTQVMVK